MPQGIELGLDLFTPRAPAVFGLDVDSASVKMVELARTRAGYRLERYAIETLPPGVIENGSIYDEDAVKNALSVCAAKFKTKLKHAAAAVSSSVIVKRNLELSDALRDEDLTTQVMQQAPSRVGIPLEQAAIDYVIGEHKPGAGGNSGDYDIVVFACEREKLEARVALVENAGFKAAIIDSDELALLDAVERTMDRGGAGSDSDLVLIMDVGSTSTHFHFYSRQAGVVFQRNPDFGTNHLTQEIETLYSVETAEADMIRLGKKAVDVTRLKVAKQGFTEAAAQEAQRAVQLLLTSTNYSSINSFVVFGSGVSGPGIAEALARVLGVSGQVLNPFKDMEISPSVSRQQLELDAPSLVTACGLAFRRFDK